MINETILDRAEQIQKEVHDSVELYYENNPCDMINYDDLCKTFIYIKLAELEEDIIALKSKLP